MLDEWKDENIGLVIKKKKDNRNRLMYDSCVGFSRQKLENNYH